MSQDLSALTTAHGPREVEWQYHEDPYQRLPLVGQPLLLRLTLLLLMLFAPCD